MACESLLASPLPGSAAAADWVFEKFGRSLLVRESGRAASSKLTYGQLSSVIQLRMVFGELGFSRTFWDLRGFSTSSDRKCSVG